MPRNNLRNAPISSTSLGSSAARDIEKELKTASYQCSVKSGKPEYEYWRKRRAKLLQAASRYRSLTTVEQQQIEDDTRYNMEESALSKRLSAVLLG